MEAKSHNRQITDEGYDRALAVKCINGTFVGEETDRGMKYLLAMLYSATLNNVKISHSPGYKNDGTINKSTQD